MNGVTTLAIPSNETTRIATELIASASTTRAA
jgi:hypothetical protein